MSLSQRRICFWILTILFDLFQLKVASNMSSNVLRHQSPVAGICPNFFGLDWRRSQSFQFKTCRKSNNNFGVWWRKRFFHPASFKGIQDRSASMLQLSSRLIDSRSQDSPAMTRSPTAATVEVRRSGCGGRRNQTRLWVERVEGVGCLKSLENGRHGL